MFGNASTPTRVYKYGAKPPEPADRVYDQIHGARHYRNALVENELDRRAAVETALRELVPDIARLTETVRALEDDLEDVRASIRRANARKRSKEPAPAKAQSARELKQQLSRARAELGAARKAAFKTDPVQGRLAEINAAAHERAKELRSDSGLHWGTYLAVEHDLRGIGTGPPPRFAGQDRYPGRLAAQIQGGASWEELLDGHGQCRIEPLPLPPNAKPGGRRSKRPWHRLYLRVGSEGPGNRTPVWVTARFALHRPVPKDAVVKWVYLVRERVGTDDQWSVQFVLAREAGWSHGDRARKGAVAVDMGWRRMEDGALRVAYALGSDGEYHELTLPAERLERWTKPEELRSIRDERFTLIRETLVGWLHAAPDVPEWLHDTLATLAQWRAQARLASVVLRWRDERFDGDDEIFSALEAWRRKDKHLYDWEAHQRRGEIRWRTDHYRRFAAHLRQNYRTVLVEDTDWSELLRQPPAEDDTAFADTRYHARLAAPGLLRRIIEAGCDDTARVSAAGSTRTCSRCGAGPAGDWDAATELEYRCAEGHTLDQDENAARNLLAAAADASDAPAA